MEDIDRRKGEQEIGRSVSHHAQEVFRALMIVMGRMRDFTAFVSRWLRESHRCKSLGQYRPAPITMMTGGRCLFDVVAQKYQNSFAAPTSQVTSDLFGISKFPHFSNKCHRGRIPT